MIEGSGGQRRHRQLDYEGRARVAVIGVPYCAGIETYLASRLVQEIGKGADFHDLANLPIKIGNLGQVVREISVCNHGVK